VRIAYVESSALVKLVLEEPESEALRGALGTYEARVTSELSVVEVTRATRRARPDAPADPDGVLARFDMLRIDRAIVDVAAHLGPASLRSLDAIHVATALAVPGELAFVAYDTRALDGATAAGLPVVSPGA
jgi:predicted nucleic acid-binding protein